MTYFPLFMNLKGKEVIVVGGGNIAARRIQVLLPFQCKITVVPLSVSEELEALAREGKIEIIRDSFSAFLEYGKKPHNLFLLLAATDQVQVNEEAAKYGRKIGALVNRADDRMDSDFYFPGIIRREPIVIGVTACGFNHRLAKQTTDFLKQCIDQTMEGQAKNETESG